VQDITKVQKLVAVVPLHEFIYHKTANVKQQDFLDLITALLKLTVFLALQSQCSAYSKAVLDDSLIAVDTTALHQHKLYYCTIALSLCEI